MITIGFSFAYYPAIAFLYEVSRPKPPEVDHEIEDDQARTALVALTGHQDAINRLRRSDAAR